MHYAVRTQDKYLVRLLMKCNTDLTIRSRDGTPLDIATEEIKCILNGTDKQSEMEESRMTFSGYISLYDSSKTFDDSSKNLDSIHAPEDTKIDEYQLQVQQNMLAHYTAEAHKNGIPKSLPLFCKRCLKPFTYPVGAVSIKCPMCLTVNEINQNQPNK